jgi:hypothetical protein
MAKPWVSALTQGFCFKSFAFFLSFSLYPLAFSFILYPLAFIFSSSQSTVARATSSSRVA